MMHIKQQPRGGSSPGRRLPGCGDDEQQGSRGVRRSLGCHPDA
jgi:hypothetical protein